MSYGQYSATGGVNRTKVDMLAACKIEAPWSRKAGKNRVHYRLADGSQGFILHETIIATVTADMETLTLADGGWPSVTTRAAMSEAAAAFGLPELRVGGARPKASHALGFAGPDGWRWGAIKFDRTVALKVVGTGYAEINRAPDAPLVRAFLQEGTESTCTVTYERRAFHSTTGVVVPCSPARALRLLHAVLRIAARGRNRIARHREPLYDYAEEIAGYSVVPHSMGRGVDIGCHGFKVADLRGMLDRLAHDYADLAPIAAKEARKLAKADKLATDKREAEIRAAWLARYRAREEHRATA